LLPPETPNPDPGKLPPAEPPDALLPPEPPTPKTPPDPPVGDPPAGDFPAEKLPLFAELPVGDLADTPEIPAVVAESDHEHKGNLVRTQTIL